jgi:hypothetical protein
MIPFNIAEIVLRVRIGLMREALTKSPMTRASPCSLCRFIFEKDWEGRRITERVRSRKILNLRGDISQSEQNEKKVNQIDSDSKNYLLP